MYGLNKQKGSVLISALLITMLVAVISTEIVLHENIQIKRTNQIWLNDRIYLDLQGFQYWAMMELANYQLDAVFLPKPFKEDEFHGALIRGEWQDMQGLFNINAVKSNEGAQKAWVKLLMAVDSTLEPDQANELLNSVKAYLMQADFMLSISELRTIKGMDQTLFLNVKPYLTALPTRENKININGINAKKSLSLLALSDQIQFEGVQKLLFCLPKVGFIKKNEFLRCAASQRVPVDPSRVLDKSNYYLAKGFVTIEGQQHVLFSFLERKVDESKHFTVRLLWQSLDTI